MSNKKMLSKRADIDKKFKWNIEDMYANDNSWETDFASLEGMAEDVSFFEGKLGESASSLCGALKARDSLWQKAERVYVYARMKSDEDTGETKYQELNRRAQGLMAQISAKLSFFTPELMELPTEKLEKFLAEDKELSIYSYMIKELIRRREHILSKDQENLMAQFGEITGATKDIFSMINNADIKFGEIRDADGDMVELTHGNFISMMESRNRSVRREAYEKLYDAFIKQKNTLASIYFYNVKKDTIISKIRKYPSSLAAELDGDNIPKSVYTNLINSINKKLPAMYKYMDLRKRFLGLEELHMYDIYAPLADMPERDVEYEDALNTVRRALKPLGEKYLSDMNEGIKSGWIDVYENVGKTSGAYSFGSYDSMPYVLLNYNNKFKDAFTIIHELGHSMNSLYTRKKQPFIYGGHSIFTAEVASTVNECLLMADLLSRCEDDMEKLYLLTIYIEEFRATVFRQTMFSEFELLAHEAVERGEILTCDRLCEIYGNLNKKYFGESVVTDGRIAMEWARIPHFYNAFYVYKYATGYSCAVAISNKLLNEGIEARNAYLNFLASGDSDYPIELLKGAGVDMTGPEVVDAALETFSSLINELEGLANKLNY